MSKLRGTGFAAVNYPTGMHLGGDPTQSLVHATTSGNFVVTMSSVDLGQGLKTILAQIAAETLGVPLDTVIVDTGDTDTGPHCTGTFASRTTHRAGNAVIMAAVEARKAMLEVAAEKLEVSVEDLETDGRGNIHVTGVEAVRRAVGEGVDEKAGRSDIEGDSAWGQGDGIGVDDLAKLSLLRGPHPHEARSNRHLRMENHLGDVDVGFYDLPSQPRRIKQGAKA